MKPIILFVLFLVILFLAIVLTSCDERVHRDRNIREISVGYAQEYVLFSGNFTIINDSIAKWKHTSIVYKRGKAKNGQIRYYGVH